MGAHSNALRNDLTHPNEYIRGSACRFLCHMREAELLEPLVPSVRANLEHRHAYVRRNAVLAIYSIYKHFESLIPVRETCSSCCCRPPSPHGPCRTHLS